MPSTELVTAIRRWSLALSHNGAANGLAGQVVIELVGELERIAWNQPRGRTPLVLWHPDGDLKKAFLLEREIRYAAS